MSFLQSQGNVPILKCGSFFISILMHTCDISLEFHIGLTYRHCDELINYN